MHRHPSATPPTNSVWCPARDFGCGTGLLTEALAPLCRMIVALDPSPKMIAVLRDKIETNGWSHVHALAATLDEALADRPSDSGFTFDVVVCSSVCAFLDAYPGAARRLASLLEPGGVFSPKLVELARARGRARASAIDYRVLDATDEAAVVTLGEGGFDAAVCTMALMDMPTICDGWSNAISSPHLPVENGQCASFVATEM